MKIDSFFALTLVAATLTLAGCAGTGARESAAESQTTIPHSPPDTPASHRVAMGELSGRTLTHEQMGFAITFPTDWDLFDPDAVPQPEDPNAAHLFRVSDRPFGSPGGPVASVACVVEYIADEPGFKGNGGDQDYVQSYFDRPRNYHAEVGTDVVFSAGDETVPIGGRPFAMMEGVFVRDGVTSHQRHYVSIEGDYSFRLVVTFGSSEQESALDAILATVEFD